MSPLGKIAYGDIDPGNGGVLIERLIDGELLLITDVTPVLRLRAHVRQLVEAYGRLDDPTGVDRFFDLPELSESDCLAEICKAFRHIRDCRLLSAMFAPLAQGIGGRSEILVDTGFFRCLFPLAIDALSKRADLAEFFLPGGDREPEPFPGGRAIGGSPHRDIPHPHYTFQYNMWFPLHDIPSGAALLLFPECYHRPVPFYEEVDRTKPPGEWGYGPAVQPAMSCGDLLLFHSQYFHASPTQEPDLTRVTVEIRVTTGCQDDNGATYRHLFWNIKNFQPSAPATPPIDHETPYLDIAGLAAFEPARITSPQHCFNALFTTAEAARMAGNIRAGHRFIHKLKPMDDNTWESIASFLIGGPYTDDLWFALVRILLLTNRARLAARFAESMLERSRSYLFLMELGGLLGRFDKISLAKRAYESARRLAADSPIAMDPFGKKIPLISESSDILLPRHAVYLCDRVLARTGSGVAGPSNINLFDYRLYCPSVEVLRIEDETGPLRLTKILALLILRRTDEPDGIVWCCELEEWMSADKLPAEVEVEDDLALELAKKYYLDMPKLIASLINQNHQLRHENETLKMALRND